MKNLKILSLSLILLIFSSCSKNVDDELSGSLLIGPFAITTITAPVAQNQFDALADKSEEERVTAYKNMFSTPYPRQFEVQAKAVLQKDYNVTDKSGTDKTIKKLIEDANSSEYKAYEYAKATNVANFGYAAGYISEEEMKAYEQDVLKEVRLHYSDWDAYLNDIIKGRDEVKGSENPQSQELFKTIVDDLLLKHEYSPYLQVGL